MGLSEAVYFSAPAWAQNVLVSMFGAYRARKRFGGHYRSIWDEIERVRAMGAGDHEEWVVRRLRAILTHSAATVPWYRDSFRKIGFEPETTNGSEALAALPILTKDIVRRHALALSSTTTKAFWRTETSGSTGSPLQITLDTYAYQLSMALLARHEADNGVTTSDRRATLAGRLLQRVDDDRPPFWRHNWAEHQMLCSAYHMSDRNLGSYVTALRRFGPAEIIGYPSAIYTLADYCRRTNTHPDLPLRLVVTNSESLFQWQRSAIEEVFGVPVRDYYGSAESVAFAAQCAEGYYHPDPLMGVCEVLDDSGLPVDAGSSGRLVCTTTSNRSMPLIRYDTGDSVTPLSGHCPCGRPGPHWLEVVGRMDDVVLTPSGRIVGRLDHVFKGVVGVREAQIAQVASDRIVLRVVPEAGYSDAVGNLLRANVGDRLGSSMQIDVALVSAVERTSRGKFRGVVREFDR